jgi:peptidoglycan/xylan/chitin deacetylase (PgdA/CDA1 family)
MNIYPIKFPSIVQNLSSFVMFKKEVLPNTIYLTFDDGPTPGITQWVLDELEKVKAQATFFCLGKNIKKYPGIFEKIIKNKHSIGNHTYFHLDGWKTKTKEYIEEVERTENLIAQYTRSRKLFRPPYGHITPIQIKRLKAKDYKVILWTSISGDFSTNINIDKVIWALSYYTKPGHILVFHDSKKAENNLKAILPEVLKNWRLKGYDFGVL